MVNSQSIKSAINTAAVTIAVTAVLWACSQYVYHGLPLSEGARARALSRIDFPIALHLATVIPSFFIGGFILARPKGTTLHKMLGRIYVCLMITTAISTFFIRSFGDGFSFIHLFAVFVLISIPLSLRDAMKGNIDRHLRGMRGNYIGLCIAGIFTFLPGRIMYGLVLGS